MKIYLSLASYSYHVTIRQFLRTPARTLVAKSTPN
jgi:hypothetical protein